MQLWKLRLSMLGTIVLIIGITTLILSFILSLLGSFNILTLALIIIPFNLLQWLFAPYMIDAIYRVKEVSPEEHPHLHSIVERLSLKSGIKKPKVMIAKIPIPNAFAYGSPITGSRVAVTQELLRTLEMEEVEAVLGHEIGHLKHKDVQIMMFASILPAIFYYLGWSFLWMPRYSREREGSPALIGLASIAVYWILSLLSLHLSRLREYYADSHSVSVVEDGARKLSEALAKIVMYTNRLKRSGLRTEGLSSFKALFISDPDRAGEDAIAMAKERMHTPDYVLVQEIISRPVTWTEKIMEIFSTHPNIVKRLRALQGMS